MKNSSREFLEESSKYLKDLLLASIPDLGEYKYTSDFETHNAIVDLYTTYTSYEIDNFKTRENAIDVIIHAIGKNELDQELSAYKWIPEEESIDTNELNVFNLDAEKEIENALITKQPSSRICKHCNGVSSA